MLTPFDHFLAVILAIVFPLRARWMMSKLVQASDDDLSRTRVATYRNAMITQWSLVAATVVLWLIYRRPWNWLGVVPAWSGGLIGILFGLAVVVVVILRQGREPDEKAAAVLRKRMEKVERLMPHTAGELRVFYLLSLTAGICEEVLYRGFYIWYFQALGLALLPAAGVACLIFGFGHLYQGPRGIVLTTVVGAFLAGVYLLSGSLVAGIVLHALMDMHSGRTLHAIYSREARPAEAVA